MECGREIRSGEGLAIWVFLFFGSGPARGLVERVGEVGSYG